MHFAYCLNKQFINVEGNRLVVDSRLSSEGIKILTSDTSEALMSPSNSNNHIRTIQEGSMIIFKTIKLIINRN